MPFLNKISSKEYINGGFVLTWTQYTCILGPKSLIWGAVLLYNTYLLSDITVSQIHFVMSQNRYCDTKNYFVISQIDFKMSQIQFCDIKIENEIITIFVKKKSLWFLYHKIGFVISQI